MVALQICACVRIHRTVHLKNNWILLFDDLESVKHIYNCLNMSFICICLIFFVIVVQCFFLLECLSYTKYWNSKAFSWRYRVFPSRLTYVLEWEGRVKITSAWSMQQFTFADFWQPWSLFFNNIHCLQKTFTVIICFSTWVPTVHISILKYTIRIFTWLSELLNFASLVSVLSLFLWIGVCYFSASGGA